MERRIRITRVWKYAGATSTPRAALRRAYRPRGTSARRLIEQEQAAQTESNVAPASNQANLAEPLRHNQQVHDLSADFSQRRRITNDKIR